jgi:hypothetical protein
MGCPKCKSERCGICRCFRHDHACISCGYKWHICPSGNIVEVVNHSDPLSCGCEDPFIRGVKVMAIKQGEGKENMEKHKEKCVGKFKEPLQYYAVKGQKYCFYCAENCILKSAKKELANYRGEGVAFDCGCGDCNP